MPTSASSPPSITRSAVFGSESRGRCPRRGALAVDLAPLAATRGLELVHLGLELAARALGEREVLLVQPQLLLLVQVLGVEQLVARAVEGEDQLVQLDLDRLGLAVLGRLDEEHHQEG